MMNKEQKIRMGIVAAVLVFVVVIVAVVIVTAGGIANSYDSHMELARQYLDDLQYEQAIAEYKAAIEIEPNNKEAYLALADIYVQQEDYEAAMDILSQGWEQTEAEEITVCLEKVEAIYAEEQKQEEQEQKVYVEEKQVWAEDVGEAEDNERHYYEDGSGWYRIDDYDDSGNLLKSTHYASDDVVQSVDEYNPNGSLKKQTIYVFNDAGAVSAYSILEYDENGNIVKSTIYHADGMMDSVSEYDEKGRLIKVSTYNDNNALLRFGLYEYDEDGKLASISTYDMSGKVQSVTVWENGKLKTETFYNYTYFYDEEGTISTYYVNEYDENENHIRQSWYDEKDRITYVAEFDEDGTLLRTIYYNADGTIWSEAVYIYHEDGTVTIEFVD